MAFLQAADGKGSERHGDDRDWTEQISCEITRQVGIGYPVGQVVKKALESVRLNDSQSRVRELLGVIVYAATAVWWELESEKEISWRQI